MQENSKKLEKKLKKRQQQRLRTAFRDAGRQAHQDIEMGVMRDVDLGDATTPPYTPPDSQAANGEET